ncbi:MAG: hypothetical protein IPM12_12920 [Flavobacteriales bacterium]|nr:hypothetical protein [Flavobacteriales bacterium]
MIAILKSTRNDDTCLKATASCIKLTALAGALVLHVASAVANNIQVANTTLTNNTGTTVQVQFDLSWENSWRGVGMPNWDAAWVFVKYRNGAGVWGHANLTATGHVVPGGATLDLGRVDNAAAYDATTNPYVGGFLYRDADGTGTFSLTGVQLQWDYSALGLAYTDIAQVQVFAIEMVYVNQGAFYVGSGGSESSHFKDGPSNNAFQITSEAALACGNVAGQLWLTSGLPPPATLPAGYPKGFAAIYFMKYELSQQGYVDFLNTLTYAQQSTRTSIAPNNGVGSPAFGTNGNRQGIDIRVPGVSPNTPAVYACNGNGNGTFDDADEGRDVACNFLSPFDTQSYLDWSGLRPITELEFEKACRGPLTPVPDEYAWGTTGIYTGPRYTIDNINLPNEGIATNFSTTLGNSYWGGVNPINYSTGPGRVGVFAANGSNSGRVTSGGSYYGIMELSGNLIEPVINVVSGTPFPFFVGIHGNGSLNPAGFPDVPSWPYTLSPGYGSSLRGSAYSAASSFGRVSDRQLASNNYTTQRFNDVGSRGARTAP